MLSRRKLIKLAAPALVIPKEAFAWRKGSPVGTAQWQTLKIGAGGWIRGIEIAADGTIAARTDTYGTWVCPPGDTIFRQCVTHSGLPIGDPMNAQGAAIIAQQPGVWAHSIAKTNTAIHYMQYGGFIYLSTDRGVTWTATAFTQDTVSNPNGGTAQYNQKMAVDPANAAIVYYGGANKISKTTNSGTSWTDISASFSATSTGYLIAFDPNSSVVGNVKQGIYVSVYGVGVYHSTNGGSTWALTTSGPTTHINMVCAADGVLYLIDNNFTPTNNNVNIFNGTTWSVKVVGGNGNAPQAVAVDPANANKIVVCNGSGTFSVSTDHGGTWTGFNVISLAATDIPWLAVTNAGFITVGNMLFDPLQSGVLYFSCGIGIFKTTNPTGTGTAVLTSQSAAIEQLVANDIICPPGGKPVVSSFDRPFFYSNNQKVYPSTYNPNPSSGNLESGFSVDYASSLSSTLVGIADGGGIAFPAEQSGKSTDGGQTWTNFATFPSIGGGCIAASTPSIIIWAEVGSLGKLNLSVNGGSTWTVPVITGIATSGTIGWGAPGAQNKRQIVAADRVDGTLYAYNFGSSSTAGLYSSSNNGTSWTRPFTGNFYSSGQDQFGTKMRSVPGNAGHLFVCSGFIQSPGFPHALTFQRSTDHGATWSEVKNSGVTNSIQEVWGFGFGPVVTTYPAIYIIGWVGGVFGLYHSIDNAATWQALSTAFPNDSLDAITCVEGDPSILDRVYVGFTGSGFAFFGTFGT